MNNITLDTIEALNRKFELAGAHDILTYFLQNYKGKIAFASSMGAEDQVITEMIAKLDREAKIFTLDTGRMFPETYDLIERTNARYKINIQIYFPEKEKVEKMVNSKGINLFYESIENRKLCCHIRKIEPLKRALQDLEVWISGLRRSQSITRKDVKVVEWDENNGLIKLNPLIEWTEARVWDYIEQNNIPYNKLHDQGFPSIGCQPCTRAIEPDEDIRAGRWWWELPEGKECGLHVKEG
ncbi:MAG: phosphoadenylyl-sulfate reductase [Bacteroidales bacterium]|nr:phosphoadenylyl-sulfate reductase [Bacteroidales bacterium]